MLEDRTGNTSKARKLFDAATVADKTHAAAWHGWAVLELREGNSGKAKTLLRKGLKFCAPNEFLLQTLALLEVKSGRYEQARSLFGKATRTNSKSAASWLVCPSMCGHVGLCLTQLNCMGIIPFLAWQLWDAHLEVYCLVCTGTCLTGLLDGGCLCFISYGKLSVFVDPYI